MREKKKKKIQVSKKQFAGRWRLWIWHICLYIILTIRNDIHEFYNASALQREIREIRKMQDGLWDSKIALTLYSLTIEGNILQTILYLGRISFHSIFVHCRILCDCLIARWFKLYLGPIHHSKLHLKRPQVCTKCIRMKSKKKKKNLNHSLSMRYLYTSITGGTSYVSTLHICMGNGISTSVTLC